MSLGLAPLVVDRLLTALRDAADRGMAVVVVEQRAATAPSTSPTTSSCCGADVSSSSGSAAELRDSFDRIERAYLTGVQE